MPRYPFKSEEQFAGILKQYSQAQVAEIAGSIRAFGFSNPILVSPEGDIIAGHGRLAAARQLALIRGAGHRLKRVERPAEAAAFARRQQDRAERDLGHAGAPSPTPRHGGSGCGPCGSWVHGAGTRPCALAGGKHRADA